MSHYLAEILSMMNFFVYLLQVSIWKQQRAVQRARYISSNCKCCQDYEKCCSI